MTSRASQVRWPGYLEWPFMGTALVSFAALYVSGKFFIALPIFATLLVLTHVIRWRVPGGQIVVWLVRVAIWVVLIATGPQRRRSGAPIYLETDYVHAFGFLCAAELVLRTWIKQRHWPSRGEALLLSAVVFTCAGNTYDRAYIPLLAPLYAMFLILSLRRMSRNDQPRTQRRTPLLVLRGGAIALALVIGFLGVVGVNRYERKLVGWAMELTRNRSRFTSAQIGLSSDQRIQATLNPSPSLERVLKIEGTSGLQHIRAMACDTYESAVWSPTMRDRNFVRVGPSELQPLRDGPRGHITRYANALDVIFTPLNAGAIESLPGEAERDSYGTLRLRESAGEMQYDVVLPPRDGFQGPLCVPLDGEMRERASIVPVEIDPKVVALAKQVAGDASPARRVLRLVEHLRSHHQYSLKYDFGQAEPISDFILNDRAAHCEFFATALVVMSRAVGVPARYVVGYYAHEIDGDGLVVRDSDAHAWVECWIDGTGWVTFDATPASGTPDAVFPQASAWRRIWERITDFPETVQRWLRRIHWQAIVWVAAAVTPVALVAVIVRRLRTRSTQAKSRDYATPNEHLRTAAGRFERLLRHRGVSLEPHRTWREQVKPEPILLSFIDTYEQARFGGADESQLSRMNALLDEMAGAP